MKELLTWEEIKIKYPNEWVSIVDFEEDEIGYVLKGRVIYHHPKKSIFAENSWKLTKENSYPKKASLYTGKHKHPRQVEFIEDEKGIS